ncbi:YceI family protein [Falsihalocynthiibacter arcticus]|uniref:YceI family protein n=1 Tax=Falsihalocynthiibacter arcticus TaxID=1579316 RepID=UPI000A56BCA0
MFTTTLKSAVVALAFAGVSSAAVAAPVAYKFDPSHSQIVFKINHLGLSTTTAMFSGFDGNIQFDQEDPAASSVEVSFPVTTLLTGWEARYDHFMSPDMFNASENSDVTFVSTNIEVTDDTNAKISGDLTINGITKPVVLDAVLNAALEEHPMAKTPWAGFDATATVLRSEFGLGAFVPFVGDEVEIAISVEAMQAE